MKYLFWALLAMACLASAWAGYHYTLGKIPVAAMTRAEASFVARAGGANTMYHAPLPSERSRTVVRPSPDQLYSICAYDLSSGPMRVHGTADLDTYWSLSFFAHNTDVFHVVNDGQLASPAFDFVLAREGAPAPDLPDGSTLILAPTPTGVVMQRVFIDATENLPALDTQRRGTVCEPL